MGRSDSVQRKRLCEHLRASDRVKPSVREKTDDELLHHYGLATSGMLTNLGVLLIGSPFDRMRLGTAPVVQALKYDEQGTKIDKFVWDDHTLSPLELIDAIWHEIPDFRETYELPDGLLRTRFPAYDEAVVRELLVNALVHRPYTQRGDIYLNLHPDRLEVVNVGRLPIGVTPRNILHESRRRNDGLARIFHELKLMEREGSGFDLMLDRLLASGRTRPTVTEGADSVTVTIPRRILHPGVMRLVAAASQQHALTQRERIALGVLCQSERQSATALAAELDLPDALFLRPWIDRLLSLKLVGTTDRMRAKRYFVQPDLLRKADFAGRTTLARIEPHRLEALILEDLSRYPESASTEIHRRVGPEIPLRTLQRTLKQLLHEGKLRAVGAARWRRYVLGGSIRHDDDVGG